VRRDADDVSLWITCTGGDDAFDSTLTSCDCSSPVEAMAICGVRGRARASVGHGVRDRSIARICFVSATTFHSLQRSSYIYEAISRRMQGGDWVGIHLQNCGVVLQRCNDDEYLRFMFPTIR
jgi:hypothetical protein